MYQIYNKDCIQGAVTHLKDDSVDLLICDPPFGLGETKFSRHYNRDKNNVINGYVEAPDEYLEFSRQWIEQAKRVMKPNGSMYIVSGWSNLLQILQGVRENDLHIINHIVWKFNFGVDTRRKFVTSHYHILYVSKSSDAKVVFNPYCRFGPQERDDRDRSLNYQDREDVWFILKEYQPNAQKNENKLPNALVEKMIMYSSNENDVVCDFFLGNFTTAYVAVDLNREPVGFEMNLTSYKHHLPLLEQAKVGEGLKDLKPVVVDLPENQYKKITDEERQRIEDRFLEIVKSGSSQKSAVEILCKEFGRGKFGITNVVAQIPVNQRKHLNGDREKIIRFAHRLWKNNEWLLKREIYERVANQFKRSPSSIEHILRENPFPER
jgi:site-specific DNA-methyltransferase (adenine-specific)